MHRHEGSFGGWADQKSATLFLHSHVALENHSGSGRSETNKRPRPNKSQLRFPPGFAGSDFRLVRLFVQAPFAAGLVFEMFDRIGHVAGVSIQTCVRERPVEQAPGRSYKRFAFAVLPIPWLFTDEENGRRLQTLAEDGLRSVFPQWARLAPAGSLAQERPFIRFWNYRFVRNFHRTSWSSGSFFRFPRLALRRRLRAIASKGAWTF